MAIFKLGAMVTSIVGSIGGTNFKRGTNNAIVTNKSFGGSRNILLQNGQLNPIANIFRRWSQLTPTERTNWDTEALNFQFPDKFGVMKNLTGRQLFTKLNIQLLPSNSSITDPSGINSTLIGLYMNTASIIIHNQFASINLDTLGGTATVLISAQISNKAILSPTFTKRKVLKKSLASGTYTILLSGEFFNEFPYFSDTYECIFYVEEINEFGFKSSPYWIKAVVQP